MKKLTATSLALTFALSCGATSALASSFEDKDMAFAFESEGTMEVATLSDQEMKETEGAAVPLVMVPYIQRAGVGAVGGGAGYVGGWLAGGYSWNTWDAGKAVGGGAVAGLLGTNNWSSMTYGSLAGGAVSSFNWNNSPLNWSSSYGNTSFGSRTNYGFNSQSFGYCGSCYNSGRR